MNVLFVGNSYTYYNDMPKIFENLANDNGKDVCAYKITRGGKHLYQNLDQNDEQYQEVISTVNQREYDLLFLQEQSFFALIDYDKFESSVLELIQFIKPKRKILYCTWGRKHGSKTLQEHGWTNESMTYKLYLAYKKVSEKAKAELSPVGICFYALLKACPELDLYDPDLSHPSYLGSCVVALTHYYTAFNELPSNFNSLDLDENTIELICTAVRKACIDF